MKDDTKKYLIGGILIYAGVEVLKFWSLKKDLKEIKKDAKETKKNSATVRDRLTKSSDDLESSTEHIKTSLDKIAGLLADHCETLDDFNSSDAVKAVRNIEELLSKKTLDLLRKEEVNQSKNDQNED